MLTFVATLACVDCDRSDPAAKVVRSKIYDRVAGRELNLSLCFKCFRKRYDELKADAYMRRN